MSTWPLPLWISLQTRKTNPWPVMLIENVDATVHITQCSSNMALNTAWLASCLDPAVDGPEARPSGPSSSPV